MSRCLRLLLLAWLCLQASVAGVAAAAPAAPPSALLLDDSRAAIDAWPAVTVLADPAGRLTLDEALQRHDDFALPQVPRANFGVRQGTLWLRLPLQVQRQGRWVMEIDYPPLNRVDVWLLSGGRVLASHRLGNDQPFDRRPMLSRAHALALDLDAGGPLDVLLRVQTTSAMLVPISLHRADDFLAHEARRQIMQGLLLGLTLALLVYSITNGLSLRDPLFAQYGLMLVGLTLFFVSYTGVGQQHLWNEQTGLLAKVAPLSVLLSLSSGSLFVCNALDTWRLHPRVALGLRLLAVVAALLLLASVAGLLDYRQTQLCATVLGPLPVLLAVHGAITQARRGDPVARMMLLGWTAYLIGALSIAALLLGLLPANFWTLHLFQFSALLETLAWMRVLGLRVEGVQRQAERIELEHQTLHSMAHTDPLTGLPNRRGLNDALGQALGASRNDSALAVFLLDLDGFKAVNDRLGHDAGDSLLVQVAHRLRGLVRSGDVVARLGGDEFVVMSAGLRGEPDAQLLARKLLDAFRQPFDAAGQRCSVGLTIGFALAPHDGREVRDLLRRADAAMYAGKQAGRHCVRRAAAVA